MPCSSGRQCLPTFADLVDELTISQIKQVLLPDGRESYIKRLNLLTHDIDLLIEEKGVELSGRVIRIIVVLAQMNLHIWFHKEKMQVDKPNYLDHLTLAHQLNGIRNQMKNLLIEETGEMEASTRKSNFQPDDLQGWDIRFE